MTLLRSILVGLAVLAALVVVNGEDSPEAPSAVAVGGVAPRAALDTSASGDALLQRARDTGDPSYYARAERAFDAALRRDARDVDALVGAGTLANLRHDFAEALRLGRAAHRVAPDLARPYTVIADAELELGRHDDAAASIQRLADLKPGLAAYARVSYFRELSGDQRGAVEAMRLAVSAGGAPEGVAYVQTLVGDLELQRGRVGAARRAYRTALASRPGHPQALAGLARVDAARGDLRTAAARLRRSTARLPLTSTLTLLADVSRRPADLEAARAAHRLYRSAGTVPDAEAVLFEANHGDPRAAVRLGRRVFAAAPGIRSADALGWALARAGRPAEGLRYARRALALGSRDPLFRLHAGLAARAAGGPAEAARHLRIAAAGRAALAPSDARRLRGHAAAGRATLPPSDARRLGKHAAAGRATLPPSNARRLGKHAAAGRAALPPSNARRREKHATAGRAALPPSDAHRLGKHAAAGRAALPLAAVDR